MKRYVKELKGNDARLAVVIRLNMLPTRSNFRNDKVLQEKCHLLYYRRRYYRTLHFMRKTRMADRNIAS